VSEKKTPKSVIYNTITEYAKRDLATNLVHAQIRDWVTDLILDALESEGMLIPSPDDGD
jgi:hypothetical protein